MAGCQYTPCRPGGGRSGGGSQTGLVLFIVCVCIVVISLGLYCCYRRAAQCDMAKRAKPANFVQLSDASDESIEIPVPQPPAAVAVAPEQATLRRQWFEGEWCVSWNDGEHCRTQCNCIHALVPKPTNIRHRVCRQVCPLPYPQRVCSKWRSSVLDRSSGRRSLQYDPVCARFVIGYNNACEPDCMGCGAATTIRMRALNATTAGINCSAYPPLFVWGDQTDCSGTTQWMVLEESDDNTLKWITNCPDANDRYITWTRIVQPPVPIAEAFIVADAVPVAQVTGQVCWVQLI